MAQSLSRVLYVDDEPGFLDLCKTFLERSGGLTVETSRSGSEALHLLRKERFDAIIADYQMPGMDGIELLITVRSDPHICEIPFILFTARGREEVVIRAINNGVDFYLQKRGETGIRFIELADTVKTAINRRNWHCHQMRDERQDSASLSPYVNIKSEFPGSGVQGRDAVRDQTGNQAGVKTADKRELRYTSIIANAPWGIHCYRLEGGAFIFEAANAAAERMTGLLTDKFLGKPVDEAFPALISAGVAKIFASINQSGESWHSKYPVRLSNTPDAKPFDLFAFRTSPGNISVILSEPAGEKERDLLPPREIYQSYIEASPDVIIITDITGSITFASPRSRSMFAIPPDLDVIGKEILAWIAPECRYQAFDCIARHMRGELAPPTMYRLLRSDGTSFPAEIHSAPVRDKNGEITGIVAIIRDSSDRIAQHEGLERANTKLNLLSSITRHDILNKITALRLYCTLIEEDEDPVQNREMIRKIEEMASIISDLVTFTSYYQNLGINTARWIAPVEVVSRIRDLIELKDIRIKNEFGQIRVLADPLFEKVLYNLFDNAVRYGGTITTIRTGYELTDEGVTLFIEDDGVGIPAKEKEKIFDRNVGTGTGLGLFLSREILSVTNLSIRERGTPGSGARFEILVPSDKYQILS